MKNLVTKQGDWKDVYPVIVFTGDSIAKQLKAQGFHCGGERVRLWESQRLATNKLFKQALLDKTMLDKLRSKMMTRIRNYIKANPECRNGK